MTVAKVEGDDIQIIYYKEVPSDGMRYSCVYNPAKASGPLKTVIEDAENELNRPSRTTADKFRDLEEQEEIEKELEALKKGRE